MGRSKHIYSTFALLLFIIILLVAVIASGFDIGDQDDDCSHGQLAQNVNGTWTCVNANSTLNSFSCPADQYIYQYYSNGSFDCRSDLQGGGTGSASWLDGGDYIYLNTTLASNILVDGYINASDWSNVTISISQIIDLVNDTNETTRLNTMIGNCTIGQFLTGFQDDGSPICGNVIAESIQTINETQYNYTNGAYSLALSNGGILWVAG